MMKKIINRINTIFLEFEVMILHLVGIVPCHYFRRFFYRLGGIEIGKGSTLHMGARFYNPWNIRIGEDSIIGEGAVLDGRDKLLIGDHVDIASEVMIYNAQHDLKDPSFRAICALVFIKVYFFFGPGAIILPGVTIKKG